MASNQPSATTSSIAGYIGEMGSSQQRQRPRNASQLTIGTFSNHASWLPHFGQRDRGRTIDRSFGQRTMHTFRNDPTHAPTMNAYACTRSDGPPASMAPPPPVHAAPRAGGR